MGTDDLAAASKSFETLAQDRTRLADLLAIAGIPSILIGVFLLPMPIRRSLAFDTTTPTLITAFTGHYVHFGLEHLLGNLVGYGIIVPLTYVLSAFVKRRWQFRVVFTSLLLGMPFALSLVNWMLLGPGLAIGFSGILLGFYGYLPIVLYQYANRYVECDASMRNVPMAFFIGIVSIAAILANQILFILLIGVISLLLVLFYLSAITEHISFQGIGLLKKAGFTELGLVAGLLYLLYPFVAFPVNLIAGSSVVNVLVHFMGYALSFISTFITAMVARWSEFLDSFRSESDNV